MFNAVTLLVTLLWHCLYIRLIPSPPSPHHSSWAMFYIFLILLVLRSTHAFTIGVKQPPTYVTEKTFDWDCFGQILCEMIDWWPWQKTPPTPTSPPLIAVSWAQHTYQDLRHLLDNREKELCVLLLCIYKYENKKLFTGNLTIPYNHKVN